MARSFWSLLLGTLALSSVLAPCFGSVVFFSVFDDPACTNMGWSIAIPSVLGCQSAKYTYYPDPSIVGMVQGTYLVNSTTCSHGVPYSVYNCDGSLFATYTPFTCMYLGSGSTYGYLGCPSVDAPSILNPSHASQSFSFLPDGPLTIETPSPTHSTKITTPILVEALRQTTRQVILDLTVKPVVETALLALKGVGMIESIIDGAATVSAEMVGATILEYRGIKSTFSMDFLTLNRKRDIVDSYVESPDSSAYTNISFTLAQSDGDFQIALNYLDQPLTWITLNVSSSGPTPLPTDNIMDLEFTFSSNFTSEVPSVQPQSSDAPSPVSPAVEQTVPPSPVSGASYTIVSLLSMGVLLFLIITL